MWGLRNSIRLGTSDLVLHITCVLSLLAVTLIMDAVYRPGTHYHRCPNLQQPCMARVPRMARRHLRESQFASLCIPGVVVRRVVEEEGIWHFCYGNGQDLLPGERYWGL